MDDGVFFPLTSVCETNVYDAGGNRRRVSIDYSPPQYAQFGLPYFVSEYAADGATEIRRSYNDYHLAQAYLDRRIIGLVSAQHVLDPVAGVWQAKVTYGYDDPAKLASQATTATQHDQSYSASFTTRGNVTSVSRWDVLDIGNATKALTSQLSYDAAGSVLTSADSLGHESSIAYADSFSDGNNGRNTFAYPTTVTNADGFGTSLQYNFDFGARTHIQGPPPANQSQGAIQVFAYDAAGRLDRVTTANNGAYRRFVYGPYYVQEFGSVNNIADDSYAIRVFDGAGRVYASAGYHPGSSGGYKAQLAYHDLMGRAMMQSNPTEITGGWVPTGDDASGWLFTSQTYDWQGRPRITTNTDGTTKEASYSGCGCAGGAVVTLTDEGTMDAGVFKRRQQKIHSDILGRTVKTELLNWEGGSVYSTTVNNYNARDQVMLARQYAGPEGSGTYQDTIMTYDGHGRPKTRHLPEQDAGTDTVWEYNADDTIHKVTDARGAAATYAYNNNRHLVTGISYSAPAGITATAPVGYAYDAAGNRTSMSDGTGSVSYAYNQLSRLTSETRAINGVGTFPLSYDYNLAGQLKSITSPFEETLNYGYDSIGRLQNIAASGYLVSQFLNSAQYRAWGTLKSTSYGNGVTESAGYNSRLQMTSRLVQNINGQTAAASTYQYYGDGRLKFGDNALEERFDRAFAYDHAAQLTEAYSGSQARDFINGTNSGTPTGPYRQSYQHNAFNQITQQTDRLWSQTQTTSNTFVNNRLQGWTYDQSGGLLSDGSISYARDAAGRFVQGGMNGSYNTNKYDGDGRLIGTGLNISGSGSLSTYYLNSSVLGLAVSKLDSNGQRLESYVYAGGRKLATATPWQVITSHDDPVTGSHGVSVTQGLYGGDAEFNADGVNVGLAEPTQEAPDFPEFKTPAVAGGGGCSIGNPNCVTVYLDGFVEPNWARVSYLINQGFARPCPDNDCGPRWNPRRDGEGRGGFEIPYLLPGGFSYEPIGSSTQPQGTPPTLRPAGARPPSADDGTNEGRSGRLGVTPQRLFNHPQCSGVEFLPLSDSYGEQGEKLIRSIIDSLKQNERCRKAFEILGLQTINQTVGKGLVIGGSTLLRSPSNNGMLGITEGARQAYWNEFRSYSARGATIMQLAGQPNPFSNARDHRPRMFIAFSAFEPGWLKETIIHEFIHAGGQPPVSSWFGHDLSNYDWYDFLLESCK